MHKAVFLDRDGVINYPANEEERYVTSVSNFRLLPRVAESVRLINESGKKAIIVTNQRGVALGRLDDRTLDEIHDYMRQQLKLGGAHIDGIFACTCDIGSACDCRKPKPGLILEASRIHNICITDSWMIGDSASDIAAGKSAGCSTILIGAHSNKKSMKSTSGIKADHLKSDLYMAVCYILGIS